jgi:hypothetical protein
MKNNENINQVQEAWALYKALLEVEALIFDYFHEEFQELDAKIKPPETKNNLPF